MTLFLVGMSLNVVSYNVGLKVTLIQHKHKGCFIKYDVTYVVCTISKGKQIICCCHRLGIGDVY